MIVIHIGMPKSGSTSIQAFLRENDRRLRALSIDYPRLGRKTRFQHQSFAHELRDNKEKYNPTLGSIFDLPGYISKHGYDTTIISSEFFVWSQLKRIIQFRDILAATGQDVLIIMIIRDLRGVVPSSYSEHVRLGKFTDDFDQFFEHRFERSRFNYAEIALRWASAFGWENLRVRLLDKDHLFGGDLIDDFFHTIGANTGARPFRRMPRPDRRNESSGWRVLEATRALYGARHGLASDHPLVRSAANTTDNRMRLRLDNALREAGALHGWMGERGRYLTARQSGVCQASFHAILRSLNGRLQTPLPDPTDLETRAFATREFLPDASLIDPTALRTFYETAGGILESVIEPPNDPSDS